MAGTLLKKDIKGRRYWYYVVCKRVNGKPKLVQQIYLGTAEQIRARKQNPESRPKEASYLEFGLPATLYQLASEIGLIPIINSFMQNTSATLDVGQYIVLAAINRVCKPRSKNGIRKWYDKTILPQLFTIESPKVNSQRFWDAMDEIDLKAIAGIEERLWEGILQEYKIPLDVFIYDTTNFFNYMSAKTESELSKRGHNKASRDHLRQVGLAVSIIRGLGLPLLHELYDGAKNDASMFPTAITNLVKRIRAIARDVEGMTIIFDKGNNSENNINRLEDARLHFIGTLKPSEYPGLCKMRISRYRGGKLSDGKEVLYYESRAEVLGKKRRVVITYNKSADKKKGLWFKRQLGKALAELNRVRWSKVKDAEAKVKEVALGHHLPSVLFRITGSGGEVKVNLALKSVRAYEQRFGKTIHFTDREDLSALEVVEGYRDRNEVEDLFKEMNDPELAPFRPVYHWTDQKIIVHAFICILGLLLFRLLQLKAKQGGIDLTLELLKEELMDIQVHIYVTVNGQIHEIISKISPLQSKLFQVYRLNEVCSKLGIQPP
jgi:transposase